MSFDRKLKEISLDDFAKLGNKKFCYMKVEELEDDEESYVLYNADGTRYAQRYSRDSALDLVDDENMKLVSVH